MISSGIFSTVLLKWKRVIIICLNPDRFSSPKWVVMKIKRFPEERIAEHQIISTPNLVSAGIRSATLTIY